MQRRDIYLKIEKLPGYSPVMPVEAEHHHYGRDCMRGHGHEDTQIPQSEVDQRRLDALVYREYLDAAYTAPNPAKLAASDVNEPAHDHRIPGCVIWAEPGQRLFVHVLNDDDAPHSFHVHGLVYGVDSDGSWPFGAASADGRRSDEICPKESWTYVFDVTDETVGAWPFHDHCHDILDSVNRGLFGAVLVRQRKGLKPDHEVPIFLHHLAGPRLTALFDSGTLRTGESYAFAFPRQGDLAYTCRFHAMTGLVHVIAGGPATAQVRILDSPTARFEPADVTVGVGGTVTWVNQGNRDHTATETGQGALGSYALNGRTFVGNTPTIVAETGERIRWYVCNLDLEMTWHNFHLHGQRWHWGHDVVDVRSLGPAESFVADTVVPPVVLVPDASCAEPKDGSAGRESGSPGRSLSASHPHSQPGTPSHAHESERSERERPKDRRRKVKVWGDFLIHCHVEQHMMEGMAGLVRAFQRLEGTDEELAELEGVLGYHLPIQDEAPHCPDVDPHRCGHEGSPGRWDRLADLDIFVVHAALLHSGKVLLYSGTAEIGGANYPLQSRLWNPADDSRTAQNFGDDLFCSGHAFLPDGRLVVAGGSATPGTGIVSTHIFDPAAESWTKVANMSQPRWYPTLLTLSDGRILAVSGRGGTTPEVFDSANWRQVTGATRNFPELYPSLQLIPSGDVFYSRCGWSVSDLGRPQTGYLRFSGPAAGSWTDLALQAFPDRQEGTAVLQVDDTATPPGARLFVFGGGSSTQANAQSGERIDLTVLSPAPSWQRTADLAARRINVSAVLMPDGKILVVGGHRNPGRFGAVDPVLEAEIYDPQLDRFTATPPMASPRGYHSVAVLLPDGRVLTAGGVNGTGPDTNQRDMEVFSPPYLFRGPRPTIAAAPASAAYGSEIAVDTPDAASIASVALLRPTSMTHHTDAGARYVKLAIRGRTANRVRVGAPSRATVAPPGYYLLFLVSTSGVPSLGRFVRVHG